MISFDWQFAYSWSRVEHPYQSLLTTGYMGDCLAYFDFTGLNPQAASPVGWFEHLSSAKRLLTLSNPAPSFTGAGLSLGRGMSASIQCQTPRAKPLQSWTLISWVRINNLDSQSAGAALSLLCGETFDALVFGGKTPGKWMSGSECSHRTVYSDVGASGYVQQVALVFDGDKRTLDLFIDGALAQSRSVIYQLNAIAKPIAHEVLINFGWREAYEGCFEGYVLAAEIYGRAMSLDQLVERDGIYANR